MNLQMQNHTEQLNSNNVFGLPTDFDVLFSNHKNIYNQKIEKRQRKLLKKLSFLSPFLDDDEKILLVTTGCSPTSVAEQLLTGWIVFYLKRALFVFTNKRFFHIPTTKNFSYRCSIAQILYADCQKIVCKGSKLIAQYKNGKTEKFVSLARRERKKIKTLLANLPLEGAQSPVPQKTHLCPRCTKPLVKNKFSCPNCNLPFKSKGKAIAVSIIFPGGGYFYTRHPYLGIGDALAEVYLSVLVILSVIGVITGAEGMVFAAFFIALILAFEKLITVYHANHFVSEFIPINRNIIPNRNAKSLTTTQAPAQTPDQPKPEQILSASWRTS